MEQEVGDILISKPMYIELKKKKNLTSHATAGEILKNKMLRNYNKITTFKTAALKI